MPREPEDVAVTMQALSGSKRSGIWTITLTFLRPVPSGGENVDQRPVIRPDREPSKLRRVLRIRHRRLGARETGLAQSGRQQVVGHAIVMLRDHRARDEE